MMFRGLLIPILTLATAASASRALANDFSVSEWSKAVAASSPGSAAQKSLLDISSLEKKALRGDERIEKPILLKARQLFAAGKFDQALATYEQVPRGSDQWLEAVEEKGWAYHRKGEFDKALAQTKTLLGGPFVSIIGSEPFFLQSLSQLKICDYKGILATHALFKQTQRERIVQLQNLAKTGQTPAVNELIQSADHFPLRLSEIGTSAKFLPRLFFRDLTVQESLMDIKLARAASALDVTSASLQTIRSISAAATAKLQKRLQQLARIENDENFKILQKLNLIEVETIQRVHADLHADKNTYRQDKFAQADQDQLVFPDDGNPWMDELDKYQMQLNSCPRHVRRKM